MERRFFQWSIASVAIGLAFLPSAHAGERKSDVARPAFAIVTAFSAPNMAKAAVFTSHKTDSANVTTRRDEPRDSGQSARPQHKTLTFFRLNPKLGDVSVQPVVGGVNGAQLSIGF
jgi:hypothetical protein